MGAKTCTLEVLPLLALIALNNLQRRSLATVAVAQVALTTDCTRGEENHVLEQRKGLNDLSHGLFAKKNVWFLACAAPQDLHMHGEVKSTHDPRDTVVSFD